MAHTPTPWLVEAERLVRYRPTSGILVWTGDRWERSGQEQRITEYPICETHTKENAAFIVQACNAHAALLEAARLVVVGGDQCFCHAGPTSWGRHRLGLGPGLCDWCVAKKAVALAEGKAK